MSSFLRIPNLSEACPEYPPAHPSISYTFPLDPFQQWAVAAIHRNENVLVTAKTGSGKTLVAEYAIAHQLALGKRVFYTTPIKSLSNQKYHDLKKLFPDASVGILTGDIKSNPDAQIVIMTTEILRNLLFKATTATATLGVAGSIRMNDVGAVVFDEVHYINDPDRGHVWEESLILIPPEIRLILLSATIDQPSAFAEWLGTIKQVPCWLLATTYRLVPLTHSIWSPGLKETLVLKDRDEAIANVATYREWLRSREACLEAHDDWKKTVAAAKRAGESAGGREGKIKLQSFPHQLNECIQTMKHRDLLPALFFAFSRKECERFADKVTGSLLTSSEESDVRHILSFHLHRHTEVLQHLPQYHQLVRLLVRGIAFHHSGLLPLLKEGVEILFQRGFIKVLFCTESLAIGVNLPARSVVFTGLEKPVGGGGNGGFRSLRYDEYSQMAGRAGRRGKDTRGYVFYLPSREPLPAEELRGTMSGSLPPLESRIQFHYDFVLKAVHLASSSSCSSCSLSLAAAEAAEAAEATPLWERLLEKSYWTVQRLSSLNRLKTQMDDAERALDVQKSRLTIAQRIALEERANLEIRARTLTNAKQKAAKLGLRRWIEEHDSAIWRTAETNWKREVDLEKHAVDLTKEWEVASRVGIADNLAPILRVLRDVGFVEGYTSSLLLGDAESGTAAPKLTHEGILATEVNEGNPILMVKLYQSRILASVTPAEIVGVLASFIVDAIPKEYDNTETQAIVPAIVPAAQTCIDGWVRTCKRLEWEHSRNAPHLFWGHPTFWSTNAFWGIILKDWMEGKEAGVIVAEYGVYEGNLMRSILKTSSLVDEWLALATFCGDLEMLDRMKDVRSTLLRGIAQPESLYLRL